MIDLRHPLPTCIEVGGVLYELDTDFRTWIEFTRAVEEDGVAPYTVFKSDVPEGTEWVEAAAEFARSENDTPHGGGGDGARTLDLIRDGDYIVGAFWQAYGIDLTTARLHWHVFLALLRSLPEGCKLTEIMGYRAFRESDLGKDAKRQYGELRRRWTLPPKRDAAILDWQERAFGSIAVPLAGDATE